MKKIYGCDVWDGLTNVFNAVVARPAVKVAKLVAKPVGAALQSAVEFASGEHLLKKYGVTSGSADELAPWCLAGASLFGLIGLSIYTSMSNVNDYNPFLHFASGLISSPVGVLFGPLPRNAYVACKAKKEEDMKRGAEGAQPQPPQV